MVKIVLCDDNLQDLSQIEKILQNWVNKQTAAKIEVEKYSDAVRINQRTEAGDIADIYILDILMGERSGIEIGKTLREHDREAAIIYITSSEEYALDAFGVYAQRYLLKPVVARELEEALNHAVENLTKKTQSRMTLKTAEGMTSVPCSHILYAECAARAVRLYLTDSRVLQSIYIRQSFETEIAQLLDTSDFLQIHKSFVINMRYVDVLGQDYVILRGGKELPISKKRISGVKRTYLQFVADRCRAGKGLGEWQ